MCILLVWWLLSKRLLQVKGLGLTGGLSMGFRERARAGAGAGAGRNWKEIRVDSHQWGKAKNVT